MKIYKSKIGVGVMLFLVLLLGSVTTIMFFLKAWIGVAICLIAIYYIRHVFMNTFYTLENDTLNIKSGIFFSKSISISSITKILETRNMESAPANSTDRIKITFNKYDYVLISPKDKYEFIKDLLEINSKIKFEIK